MRIANKARAFRTRVGTKARALRAAECEFRTRKMYAVTALVTGWLVVSHLSKTPGVDTTADNNTTITTDNNTTTDDTGAARKATAVLAPETVSSVCRCCACLECLRVLAGARSRPPLERFSSIGEPFPLRCSPFPLSSIGF
jgi:hypothetical protein